MSPPSPSLSSKRSTSPQPSQQNLLRPHPPRLQHSPSLPNIWFPPHSGPIPPKLNSMSRDNVQVLSDSEFSEKHEKKQLEHKPSLISFREKTQISRPHVKIVSGKQPGRRQRVENEPHKLLTPPLTPSSSIRTTTSVDSSVGHRDSLCSEQSSEETGGGDDVAAPSRFLRVDNVSPDVPQEVVKNAISFSITTPKLACYRPDTELPTPITPSTKDENVQDNCPRSLLDNPIKGLLLRSGFIFLAFHDLRDAIAAKKYFETRESDVFDNCVGQAKDGTGRLRLTCRYLTMDQVTLELGASSFLESMDASFEITVEHDVPVEVVTRGPKEPVHIEQIDKKEKSGIATREIVLLQTYLETCGDIRALSDTTAQSGRQTSNSECKTFRVEFFDIRETTSAYESLDGMVLFGMKIRVSGREDIVNVKAKDHVDSEIMQRNTPENPGIIPFPISRAFDDYAQPFGPPGQFSQTRQPFSINGSLNDDTLRNDLPISSENGGSPPVFYTSINHVASGAPVGLNGKSPGERNGQDQHQPLQNYYHGSAYPTFDGTPSPAPLMPYFAPTPTPPIAFHHGYLSPPPPSHFSCHGHLPGGLISFERDPTMMQQMNMPWPIEMMNGMPAYPPGFPLNSARDPYWLQGATPRGFSGSGSNASYFSPRTPDGPGSPPSDEFSGQPSSAQEGSERRDIFPSPSYLSRNSRTSLSKKETLERNQLNFAKIESGNDSRTTAMIKNIPNKMTDKDLIQYIAKVIPRRIDFLYLRIDFKNGCNVGYAFVNFIRDINLKDGISISVEDLLLFAKARLGQKWNMFSSEKVLQMSYANYQGKEALVDKFKNSCIMDEREAWRPKIFYSEPGPDQGLLQPFPAPTHQRRKERSSHNRGALFVPGNQKQNPLNIPFSPQRVDFQARDRHERERAHRTRKHTSFAAQ
ncbi:RNA recognition motif 2-domain-containing protein [Lentinula aff. detonsa]|uniref:RNA recognition motif 2-domain-containing protein n=1 Tax=Lentinula aff. detonsa TaxID=2804958 RepID=A0AA38NTI1_9AGAR|nr:RNA recognition motif 2-domain-containing protein [Lentinula aff. detonsa]